MNLKDTQWRERRKNPELLIEWINTQFQQNFTAIVVPIPIQMIPQLPIIAKLEPTGTGSTQITFHRKRQK